MAVPLRQVLSVQKALLASRCVPRISTTLTTNTALRAASTLNDGASKAHDHSLHFKVERLWAAGMLPIIPGAYFIHGPVMDAVLTIALTLHIHWGVQGVVADYARPYVIGEGAAKASKAGVYVLTGLLLAGLLHFNTNDVGLTKAFELVFSL